MVFFETILISNSALAASNVVVCIHECGEDFKPRRIKSGQPHNDFIYS